MKFFLSTYRQEARHQGYFDSLKVRWAGRRSFQTYCTFLVLEGNLQRSHRPSELTGGGTKKVQPEIHMRVTFWIKVLPAIISFRFHWNYRISCFDISLTKTNAWMNLKFIEWFRLLPQYQRISQTRKRKCRACASSSWNFMNFSMVTDLKIVWSFGHWSREIFFSSKQDENKRV